MFRNIQNHPVALLAVGAVAFGAWLWYDATPSAAAPVPAETVESRPEPPPFLAKPVPHRDPRPLLAHLPPGAPRAIVEHLLGLRPMPHDVSPVSIDEGSATYTVTYPMPGRPLVLEFDATQPGHPFVGSTDAGPRT